MKIIAKDQSGLRLLLSTNVDSQAKRVYSKAHGCYVMSANAGVTEAPLNTEWVATKGIVKDNETALVIEHKCKLYDGYTTRYLNEVGIERVREFLSSTQQFTAPIKRGVYLSPAPKAHYRNQYTGTGSKDAPQAPIWGYKWFKSPSKTHLDAIEYVGIDYQERLPLSSVYQYTPAVAPTLYEVTQFLPCGLADQKLLFVPRHAKTLMQKGSALDRVFVSRELYPKEQLTKALSLDSNQDDLKGREWMPTSEDPIELMSRNEEYRTRQRDARIELERMKQLIGDEKYKVLIMSAEGHSNSVIAEEIGKSTEATKKLLQRVRKQLKDAGFN